MGKLRLRQVVVLAEVIQWPVKSMEEQDLNPAPTFATPETVPRETDFSLSPWFSLKNKFIYLFLVVLGLRCWAQAFSSCGKWGLLFIAVRRLLIAVASLVAEHGLEACGLSSCGTWASVVVACGL